MARVGSEGTGSYGAGLTRWLRSQEVVVVELERPNRRLRHHRGTSDTVDAEAGSRAVQANTATGQSKTGDGHVEAMRVLRTARRSAVKARTPAMHQLHALVVTAPEALRTQRRPLSPVALVTVVARFRPPNSPATPVAATKAALNGIAQRYQALTQEIARLAQQLAPLVAITAPTLVAITGVGTDTAGTLLVAAGDHPDRLRSEAAFVHLCGVAPVPASSGNIQRYRLHRGGDRDANRALSLLAMGRLGWDEGTRTDAAKRTREGKSKPAIIRCLKRYIAREIDHALVAPAA